MRWKFGIAKIRDWRFGGFRGDLLVCPVDALKVSSTVDGDSDDI